MFDSADPKTDMALDPEIHRKIKGLGGYDEVEEVMLHYTVTGACPFHCVGCINALTADAVDGRVAESDGGEALKRDVERDIRGMARLIEHSGKREAVIVFYGGEPMLRLDRMNRVYEGLGKGGDPSRSIRFAVITSGHFLDRAIHLYPELSANMWLTAVSVDGTEEQHQSLRRGTSLAEIRNRVADLNRVRRGDVLIWSTMRPGMSLLDCFRSFMHFRDRGEAEHFFWHWEEAREAVQDFSPYLDGYLRDMEEVMGVYLEHLGRGDLLSIVHVNELILYLITGKRRGSTSCGVEKMANFDITGDGMVHACADLPSDMSIGRIGDRGEIIFKEDAGTLLGRLVDYRADLGCGGCGIEPYCGGRCPVQIHTGGMERARQYCSMMRAHVALVKGYMERIAGLLVGHDITASDVYRSARYAKFTDVTP